MDDLAALKNCIDGDKDSFRFLVERYQHQAIGHATAVLGNKEDALDAVQETFIDAYRAIYKFDFSRRFCPWFYVLPRNKEPELTQKLGVIGLPDIRFATPDGKIIHKTIGFQDA